MYSYIFSYKVVHILEYAGVQLDIYVYIRLYVYILIHIHIKILDVRFFKAFKSYAGGCYFRRIVDTLFLEIQRLIFPFSHDAQAKVAVFS